MTSIFFQLQSGSLRGAPIVYMRARTHIYEGLVKNGPILSWMSLHIFRIPFFCCAIDHRGEEERETKREGEREIYIYQRVNIGNTHRVYSRCTHGALRVTTGPSVRSSVRFVPCISATNMTETRGDTISLFSLVSAAHAVSLCPAFAISRR